MRRWRARLIGEKFDLEEIPRLFTAPERRVVEDEGDYFLESESFEMLEDVADVHEEATRLLALINGAARLKRGNFRRVQEGAIIEFKPDDTKQGTVFASTDAVIARGKVVATGTVGDEHAMRPIPGSQETDKWLALADRDRDTAEVLQMWADPVRDRHTLYGVFEIIQKGGTDIEAWASRKEVSRFTQTAQMERHTRLSTQLPKSPMSLLDAERLIERILLQWIRSRA